MATREFFWVLSAIDLSTQVRTEGFPPGRYRFYIQYKKLASGGAALVEEERTDFWVI